MELLETLIFCEPYLAAEFFRASMTNDGISCNISGKTREREPATFWTIYIHCAGRTVVRSARRRLGPESPAYDIFRGLKPNGASVQPRLRGSSQRPVSRTNPAE
jgi:hypothetical protein